MSRATTVPPHVFAADPDLPADHTGRHICAVCHLLGRTGDAHHTLPDVPEQADHARRYDREEA